MSDDKEIAIDDDAEEEESPEHDPFLPDRSICPHCGIHIDEEDEARKRCSFCGHSLRGDP